MQIYNVHKFKMAAIFIVLWQISRNRVNEIVFKGVTKGSYL